MPVIQTVQHGKPSQSSDVITKTRTARNNAETKLLQEAAILESEGVKGAINAAKYYVHAKRKGKEVEFSEEFKDLQDYADDVLNKDSEIHYLKKSYNDNSFEPSPLAKESKTYEKQPPKPKQVATQTAPTVPLSEKLTKNFQAKDKPKILPQANAPIAQPKQAITQPVQQPVPQPTDTTIGKPDVNRFLKPTPTAIATPATKVNDYLPSSGNYSSPWEGLGDMLEDNKTKEGYVPILGKPQPKQVSKPKQQRNLLSHDLTVSVGGNPNQGTDDVVFKNETEDEKTDRYLNSIGPRSEAKRKVWVAEQKALLKAQAKTNEANARNVFKTADQWNKADDSHLSKMLQEDKELKKMPNDIAAHKYLIDTYGGVAGPKMSEMYSKSRTDFQDSPSYNIFRKAHDKVFENNRATETGSTVKLTQEEQYRAKQAEKFKFDPKTVKENVAKILPKSLRDEGKRLLSSAYVDPKVKEEIEPQLDDPYDDYAKRVRSSKVLNDLVKFDGKNFKFADPKDIAEARFQLEDVRTGAVDGIFAKLGNEYKQNLIQQTLDDHNLDHINNFFTSVFGGYQGKKWAEDKFAHASTNKALIELEGWVKKSGENLDATSSNLKDVADLGSMNQTDAFGASTIANNAGKDMNVFGWYQNAKDIMFGSQAQMYSALKKLENPLEFVFGNATSDLQAKLLAQQILHESGELDMLENPDYGKTPEEQQTMREKLDKVMKDNTKYVTTINNILDMATMFTPVGTWGQASAVGHGIGVGAKTGAKMLSKVDDFAMDVIKYGKKALTEENEISMMGKFIKKMPGFNQVKSGTNAIKSSLDDAAYFAKDVIDKSEDLVRYNIGKPLGAKWDAMKKGIKPLEAHVEAIADAIRPLLERTEAYKARTKMFQDIYGLLPESAARATATSFATQFFNRDVNGSKDAVENAITMGAMDLANNAFGRLLGGYLAPIASDIQKLGRNMGTKNAQLIADAGAHVLYQAAGAGVGLAKVAVTNPEAGWLEFTEEAISNVIFGMAATKGHYKNHGRRVITDLAALRSAYSYKVRHGEKTGVTVGEDMQSRVGGKDVTTLGELHGSMNVFERNDMTKEEKRAMKTQLELAGDTPVEFTSFETNEAVPIEMKDEPAVHMKGKILVNKDALKDEKGNLYGEEYNTAEIINTLLTHEVTHETTERAVEANPEIETNFQQGLALKIFDHFENSEIGANAVYDDPVLANMMHHMAKTDADGNSTGLDMSEFYAQYFQKDSVLREHIDGLKDGRFKADIEEFFKESILSNVPKERRQEVLDDIKQVHAINRKTLSDPNQISMFDDDEDGTVTGLGKHITSFDDNRNALTDNLSFMPQKLNFKNTYDMKDYYLGKERTEIAADVEEKLVRYGLDPVQAKKEADDFAYKMNIAKRLPVVTIQNKDGMFISTKHNVANRLSNTKQIDSIVYDAVYQHRIFEELNKDMASHGYTRSSLIADFAEGLLNPHLINERQSDRQGKIKKDDLSIDAKNATLANRNFALIDGYFFTTSDGMKAIPVPKIGEALQGLRDGILNNDFNARKKANNALMAAASGLDKYGFFRMLDVVHPELARIGIDDTHSGLGSHIKFTKFVNGDADYLSTDLKLSPEQATQLNDFRTKYYGENKPLWADVEGVNERLKTEKGKESKYIDEVATMMQNSLHGYYAWNYDSVGANRMGDGTMKHQGKYEPVLNTRAEYIQGTEHWENKLDIKGKDNTQYYEERGIVYDGENLKYRQGIMPPDVLPLLTPEAARYFQDSTADGGVYVNNKLMDSLVQFRDALPGDTNFMKLKGVDDDYINKAGWHRDKTNFFSPVTESGKTWGMLGGNSAFKAKYARQANQRTLHTEFGKVVLTPENRIIHNLCDTGAAEKWTQSIADKINNRIMPDDIFMERHLTGNRGFTFIQEGHSPTKNKGFALGTAGSIQLAFGESPAMKRLRQVHTDLHDRLADYHYADMEGLSVLEKIAANFTDRDDTIVEGGASISVFEGRPFHPDDLYKAGRMMNYMTNKLMQKFKNNDIPISLRAIIKPEELQVMLAKCVNGDGTINAKEFAKFAAFYPDIAGKETSMLAKQREYTLDALRKMQTQGFMVTIGMPQDVREWVKAGLSQHYGAKMGPLKDAREQILKVYQAIDADKEFTSWQLGYERTVKSVEYATEALKNATDGYSQGKWKRKLDEAQAELNTITSSPEYADNAELLEVKKQYEYQLEDNRRAIAEAETTLRAEHDDFREQVMACIDPITGTILPGAKMKDGSVPVILGADEIRLLNKHQGENDVPIIPSTHTSDLLKATDGMRFIGEMPEETAFEAIDATGELISQVDMTIDRPQLNEKFGFNDLDKFTDFRGFAIELLDGIPTDKDKPVMARANQSRTRMQLSPKDIENGFTTKSWRVPAKQKDGSYATPLEDFQFRNKEEFLKFVILHEAAHKDLAKLPDETIGQYEDRVNRLALLELHKGKRRQALSESPKNTEFMRTANGKVLVNINNMEGALPQVMNDINKAAWLNNTIVIPNHTRNMPLINYCRDKGYKTEILIYDKFDQAESYIPPTTTGRDWFHKNREEISRIGVGSKVFGVLTPSAGVESMVPQTIIGIGDAGMMYTDNEFMTKYLGRDFDADKLGIMAHSPYFPEEEFNKYYEALLDLYKGIESKNDGIEENPLAVIDAMQSKDFTGEMNRQTNTMMEHFDRNKGKEVSVSEDKKVTIPRVGKSTFTSRPQDPGFAQAISEMGNSIGAAVGTRNSIADYEMYSERGDDYGDAANTLKDQNINGMSRLSAVINQQMNLSVDAYNYRNYRPEEVAKATAAALGARGVREKYVTDAKTQEPISTGQFEVQKFEEDEPFTVKYKDKNRLKIDGTESYVKMEGTLPSANQYAHDAIKRGLNKRMQATALKNSDNLKHYISKLAEANGITGTKATQIFHDYQQTETTARRMLSYAMSNVGKAAYNAAHQSAKMMRDTGNNHGIGAGTTYVSPKDMERATFGPEDAMTKQQIMRERKDLGFTQPDKQGHNYQTIMAGTIFNVMAKTFQKRGGVDRWMNVAKDEAINDPNKIYLRQLHDKVEGYRNGEKLGETYFADFFHPDGRPNKIPKALRNEQLWQTLQTNTLPKHLATELTGALASNIGKYLSNVMKEKHGIDISPDIIAPRLIYGTYGEKDKTSGQYVQKEVQTYLPDTDWSLDGEILSKKKDIPKQNEVDKINMGVMGLPEQFEKYGIKAKVLGTQQGSVMDFNDNIKRTVNDTVEMMYNKKGLIESMYQKRKDAPQVHAISLKTISGMRGRDGVSRADVMDLFKKNIAGSTDFDKADGTKATLHEIVENPEMYKAFHKKVIAPAINQLLGSKVENRDLMIETLINAYSPEKMDSIESMTHRGQNTVTALKGLALAELGQHINRLNQADKFQRMGNSTDFSLIHSTMPCSIIDRTASVKKDYYGDQIVSENFVMKDGVFTKVEPTRILDLIDEGTLVASPIQMKSPLEVECIRPLESLRTTMDAAMQVLENLDVENLDIDGYIQSGLEVHVDVDSDGNMGATRYRINKDGVRGELDYLTQDVIKSKYVVGNDERMAHTIKSMQAIKATGGALRIAAHKMQALMENAPSDMMQSMQEQMRSINHLADKMLEGDMEYLSNRSLTTSMTNSEMSNKLGDMISSVHKAESDNIHAKQRLRTTIHESLGTRLPMNMMFDDNYSSAIDEVAKIAEHMVKSEEVHPDDSSDYADYMTKGNEAGKSIDAMKAQDYYKEKAINILETAFKDNVNRYKDFARPHRDGRNQLVENIVKKVHNVDSEHLRTPEGEELVLSSMSSLFDNLHEPIDFTKIDEGRAKFEADLRYVRNDLEKLGVDVQLFDQLLQDKTMNTEDAVKQVLPQGIQNELKATSKAYRYANSYKYGVAEHVRNGWKYARKAAEQGYYDIAHKEYEKWYNYVQRETAQMTQLSRGADGNALRAIAEKAFDTAINSHREAITNGGTAYEMMHKLNVPGYHKKPHEFENPNEYNELANRARNWLSKSRERFHKEVTNSLKIHDWYGSLKRDEFAYTDSEGNIQSMPEELVMEGITPAMLCKVFDEITGKTDVEYSHNSKSIIRNINSSINRIMHVIDGEMVKKVHSYGETSQHALDVASRAVGRGYKNNLIFNKNNENFVDVEAVKSKMLDVNYMVHESAGTPVLVQVRKYQDGVPSGSHTDVVGDVVGYYNRKAEQEDGDIKNIPTMVIYDPQTHQLHNIDMDQVETLVEGTYNSSTSNQKFRQAKEAYQRHSQELLKGLCDEKLLPTKVFTMKEEVGPVKSEAQRGRAFVDIGSEFRGTGELGEVAMGAISALRQDLEDVKPGVMENLLTTAYNMRVATTYGIAGDVLKLAGAAVALGTGNFGIAGGLALKAGGNITKKIIRNLVGNTLGVASGISNRAIGSKSAIGTIYNAFKTPVSKATRIFTGDASKIKGLSEVLPTQGGDLIRNRLESITADKVAANVLSKEFKKKISEIKAAQEQLKIITDIYETDLKYMDFDNVRKRVAEVLEEHGHKYDGITIESLGKNDWDFTVNGFHFNDIRNFKMSLTDMIMHFSTVGGRFQKWEKVSTFNAKQTVDSYVKDLINRTQAFDAVMGNNGLETSNVVFHTVGKSLINKSIGNYERTPAQETLLGRNLSLFRHFGQERTLDSQTYHMRRRDMWNFMNEFMKADPNYLAMCEEQGLRGLLIDNQLLYDPNQELMNRVPMMMLGSLTNGLPAVLLSSSVLSAINNFFWDEKGAGEVSIMPIISPNITHGQMIGSFAKTMLDVLMMAEKGENTKLNGRKVGADRYERAVNNLITLPGDMAKSAFSLGVSQSDIAEMMGIMSIGVYQAYRGAGLGYASGKRTKKTIDNNAFFLKFAKVSTELLAMTVPLLDKTTSLTLDTFKAIEKANEEEKKNRRRRRSE